MKKILLVVLLMISAISFGGIFGRGGDSAEYKYLLTTESAKKWDETISNIIKEEAYIDDWYGGDNVILYLRQSGIMKEKDYQFLTSLSSKEEYEIVGDDFNSFVDLVDKYRKKVPRTFQLRNENIKNPKGLVTKIVLEGTVSKLNNPSTQIKAVLKPEDWNQLVAYAKQRDLTAKDAKQVRKILNSVIKDDNFFNPTVWYNSEVSTRIKQLADLNSGLVGKRERNNINAKALYIAYSEYLSEPSKWGK